MSCTLFLEGSIRLAFLLQSESTPKSAMLIVLLYSDLVYGHTLLSSHSLTSTASLL